MKAWARLVPLISGALLSAWVVVEWLRPPELPTLSIDKNEPDSGGSAGLPSADVEFLSLETFSDTLDRPIFNQTRRPFVAEETEGTTDPLLDARSSAPPPPMRLSAVIITPTERSALLETSGSNKPKRVREGESLEGWNLVKIDEEMVVLKSGAREERLELRTFEAPGPVPTRRPNRSRLKRKPLARQRSRNLNRRLVKPREKPKVIPPRDPNH